MMFKNSGSTEIGYEIYHCNFGVVFIGTSWTLTRDSCMEQSSCVDIVEWNPFALYRT